MDFGGLLKKSWELFLAEIVQLILFFLVGGILSMTIILIPTVCRGFVKGFIDYVKNGTKPEFSLLWDFEGFGGTLVLLIIMGVGITIGSMLLLLPGLFLMLIWMYALQFQVDKGMGAVDALKASQGLVFSDFGTHIVVWLIFGVLVSVGSAVAGFGAIITGPLAFLFLTIAYLETAK